MSDEKLVGKTATITDIQGRVLTDFMLKKHTQINIQNWACGLYFLRLPDGEVIKVVKD